MHATELPLFCTLTQLAVIGLPRPHAQADTAQPSPLGERASGPWPAPVASSR